MIGRHLLGYLPVQVCQAVIGFGGVAVFTRLMSAEDYGVLSLVLAVLAFAHIVTFTWLQASLARFHARASVRGRLRDHLKTAYAIYFALAALIALSIGLALIFVPMGPSIQNALVFGGALFLLRGLLQVGLESRKAAGEVGAYSALQSAYLLAGFALGIGLLLGTELGAASVLAGSVMAAAIVLVFDLPVMASRARAGRVQSARVIVYARFGAAVSASLVFESLLSVGDRFLIAGFLGNGALGTYAAGYGLGDRLLDIVFIWFGMAVWPLTVKAFEREGEGAARRVAGQAASLMGLISFPAAIGLVLIAQPLAGFMLGESVREGAATIIPWIAVAGLLNGMMTYYFHEAFTLKRRSGVMAGLMAVAAVLNIALNLVLIPRLGILGAAYSTVLAYALALIVSALVGRRFFDLPLPWMDWAKAALATGVMALGVLAIPNTQSAGLDLITHVLVGAGIYGGLALALNIAGCRSWFAVLAPRLQGLAARSR